MEGSPPRVWGRLVFFSLTRLRRGFTPTRVGKTEYQSTGNIGTQVHPHACGEDQGMFSTVDDDDVHPHACGKTMTPTMVRSGTRVHPHACGEDFTPAETANTMRFTPTRWGRRIWRHGGNEIYRFTPRVWEDTEPLTASSARQVHPHACGKTRGYCASA